MNSLMSQVTDSTAELTLDMFMAPPTIGDQADIRLDWTDVEEFYLVGSNLVATELQHLKPFVRDCDDEMESDEIRLYCRDQEVSATELEREIDSIIDSLISSVNLQGSAVQSPLSQHAYEAYEAPAPQGVQFSLMSVQSILSKGTSLLQLVEYGLLQRVITDHFGSKHIQNLIQSSCDEDRLRIIAIMLQALCNEQVDLCELCEDMHANYVIQQFFTFGNDFHHATLMRNVINPCVFRLSRSKYGCRVVQEILSCVKNEPLICLLVQSFAKQSVGQLRECLVCYNGNHVIQAILKLKLDAKRISFITDELNSALVEYACDVYACRVIQVYNSMYASNLLDFSQLFDNNEHIKLCCQKYANYVIQNKIESNQSFRNKVISDMFDGRHLATVSCDRFGSNAVETCIRLATQNQLCLLILELCANRCFLAKQLAFDRYGNYVMTTLFKACNARQKRHLTNVLKRDMSHQSYGNSKYNKALMKLLKVQNTTYAILS